MAFELNAALMMAFPEGRTTPEADNGTPVPVLNAPGFNVTTLVVALEAWELFTMGDRPARLIRTTLLCPGVEEEVIMYTGRPVEGDDPEAETVTPTGAPGKIRAPAGITFTPGANTPPGPPSLSCMEGDMEVIGRGLLPGRVLREAIEVMILAGDKLDSPTKVEGGVKPEASLKDLWIELAMVSSMREGLGVGVTVEEEEEEGVVVVVGGGRVEGGGGGAEGRILACCFRPRPLPFVLGEPLASLPSFWGGKGVLGRTGGMLLVGPTLGEALR